MFAPGEKIYDYEYNHTLFATKQQKGIKITTYTVKECKNGQIFLQGGYEWSVRYEQIGHEFFGSKESLVLAAIRNNLKEAESIDDYEDLQSMIEELRRLAAKLKLLQKED